MWLYSAFRAVPCHECDAPHPTLWTLFRRQGERIAFGFLVSQKFAGEKASLQVLRAGKEKEVEVELARPQALVPLHLDGGNPSYLVVAGRNPQRPRCASASLISRFWLRNIYYTGTEGNIY